ncbi:MAG: PKD domain-containing protein [Vicinamibacterales bacterium]
MERKRPDNPRTADGGVMGPESAVTFSGDNRIDALLSGAMWSQTTITYSFYENDVYAGSYYGSEVVSEVSEPVKTNARAIMAWYGTMMNRTFVEVTETSTAYGTIRFMDSTAPGYAYAYYPSSNPLGGDVHLNINYDRLGDTNGFQHPAGEHGYVSIIHEVGHALGLKHPHDGSPNLPAAQDNHTHTVMSYQFYGESPGTPMGFDIMALHHIYGVRSYRTLNDSYQFTGSAIDQYSLGGQLYINPTLRTKQVIWDNGGYNVLDLSGFTASTSGYRLDLNPLGWLSTNANYLTTYLNAGTVIGNGVSIHQLINSGSADTIYANANANVFSGYASNRVTGADVINGATTADTVDLSGYAPGQVMPTASGNDMVLTFSGTNSSIRLVGYYASVGNQPAIVYSSVTPAVSIGDVSLNEGSTTTTANFVVTLSVPAATTQTVSYATSDCGPSLGCATAGSDYTSASNTLTFIAGETQKTVSVTILGDTTEEQNEAFSVTLSSPSAGIEMGDGQATGTIVNDDLPPNALPSAFITATPTSGYGPLQVTFTGSGADTDGTIVSYAWTFGDGASSTAQNPGVHTYSSPGVYTATLTVTDNRGGTGSAQQTITVTQNPALTLRVSSITMQLVTSGSGTAARATVTVVDGAGSVVQGATVTGNWTGLVKSTSTATTGTNGQAVLNSRASRKKGTFTITITGVSRTGYTYNANAQGNVKTNSIVVP